MESLRFRRSKDRFAGMSGSLDVICLEQVEIDGSDTSRWFGLCGTISSKMINKETEELIVAAAQLRFWRSVMPDRCGFLLDSCVSRDRFHPTGTIVNASQET